MTDTPLYNTCTVKATGHLFRGETIRVRLPEGDYPCTVPKHLFKKLSGVVAGATTPDEGLLRFIFYPRTTPAGAVRLHLVRFDPTEKAEASKLYAVGKIRYADDKRAALRIYPNPKGQLKRPFTVQLEHDLSEVPVKVPVRCWGGLKGEHLTLERLSVLEQLPPRDESYKAERGRR